MTKDTPDNWDWDKYPQGLVGVIVEADNLARRNRKRKKMQAWTPQHETLTPAKQIERAVDKWLGSDVQPGQIPNYLIPCEGMNSIEVNKGRYYIVLRNEDNEIIATYFIKSASLKIRKTPIYGERIYMQPMKGAQK